MEAPAITSSPTVTNTITARPHIRCRACPRPGSSQPAMPTPQALLCEGALASAPEGGVSTEVVSLDSWLICLVMVPSSCEKRQDSRLDRAGHAGFLFVHIHIHFRAHAKLREVDSGLDGIAGARDQVTLILSFESIHVNAIAVHRGADVVAGAMKEIFSVAGLFHNASRGFIHLPSLQGLPCLYAGED